MDSKKEMKIYLILTVIFSVIFLLTLAFAVLVQYNEYFLGDCAEIDITIKRIYNNKSVNIRIETDEYEAVFTIPTTFETTKFMNEIKSSPNGDVNETVKAKIYIVKRDVSALNEKPRREIRIKQFQLENSSDTLISFSETNNVGWQNLVGYKIMMISFAGCATVVSLYHTFRTRPKSGPEFCGDAR